MNIGIVTTWFERGAAYVSRQYATVLQRCHNVFIYARGGEKYAKKDCDWDSDRVWWGKRTILPALTPIVLSDLREWIRKRQIDLVFFNEQHWWEPVIQCKDMGVTIGSYIDYYTNKTIPLFDAYDFIICNTLKHFSAFDWHPAVHYIPWGTDVGLFAPQSERMVEEGMVVFFHSCGYDPYRKNTAMVLRAFNNMPTNTRLVIHSQVDIYSVAPEVRELASRLEATGRLIYYQKTVPAPGLYHCGDVYLYPSSSDGIGLTISEALASGLFVITTDAAPMNEFVGHEGGTTVSIDRYYLEQSDPFYWPRAKVNDLDLENKMRECVCDYPNICARKRAARAYALSTRDWATNAREIPDIFSHVTSRGRLSQKLVDAMRKTDRTRLPYGRKLAALYPLHYWIDGMFKVVGRTYDNVMPE